MTTPSFGALPSEIILPNGKTGYLNPYTGKYSSSRSYAMRMQRNYSRGLSQSAARGHAPSGGLSESQMRAQREALKYGDQLKPWQRFALTFKQRYGFEYRYWRKLKRLYIDAINSMSSPDMQITPVWIQQALVNAPLTGHDESWIEARLAEKLYDMDRYRNAHDPIPGRMHFMRRDSMEPVEWWYYH